MHKNFKVEMQSSASSRNDRNSIGLKPNLMRRKACWQDYEI